MRTAAVSELKAKLAKYLRIVKSGETVEIQERGVPIAVLKSVTESIPTLVLTPRKDPSRLGKFHFSIRPSKNFDIVSQILEERRK